MAYNIEHLHLAQAVDEAIDRERGIDRLVVVRFGRGGHEDCVRFDAAMAAAAKRVGPVAALYAIDIKEVEDFNYMYQLQEPCTVMFFYRNCHVDVRRLWCRYDIDWPTYGGDEFAGVVHAVHERARAGRRIVNLNEVGF